MEHTLVLINYSLFNFRENVLTDLEISLNYGIRRLLKKISAYLYKVTSFLSIRLLTV